MNNHDPAPPPIVQERFAVRLVRYVIAGALAGAVIGIWSEIVKQAVEDWHARLDPISFLANLGARFMRLQECLESIGGAAVGGILGGLITACFSKRTRHPIILASLWASILGSVSLAMIAMVSIMDRNPQRVDDIIMMLAASLTSGAIYGFVLGLGARLMERALKRSV